MRKQLNLFLCLLSLLSLLLTLSACKTKPQEIQSGDQSGVQPSPTVTNATIPPEETALIPLPTTPTPEPSPTTTPAT
ncbi:MAG: hypothetical protein II272_04335 [Oscillospiraceae bacterium]|nr:hypothetical protein [Oscillospiraceae bacterium]